MTDRLDAIAVELERGGQADSIFQSAELDYMTSEHRIWLRWLVAEVRRLRGVSSLLADELRRERTIASETEARLETENARLREALAEIASDAPPQSETENCALTALEENQ